ncbi:MAG: N-acetylmuramoyl-L-alanine amidase [Spirochaetes bacterium]|nr:N-acetylmuramoyl-L-alanine amidase [Spirochaetota bacterium]
MLKKNFFLLIYFFTITALFSQSEKFLPLNHIIQTDNIDIEYYSDMGKIILKKNKKNVILLINSPYLIIENKNYFINDIVLFKNGTVYIPENLYLLIKKYLTSNKDFIKHKYITLNNISDNYYLNSPAVHAQNKKSMEDKTSKSSGYKENPDNKNISNSKEVLSADNVNVKDRYIFDKEVSEKIKINAIIIDPGHGGSDPGAIGFSGIKEKEIVLKTSLLLYDKLKDVFKDKKIILTRDKDEYISLDKRSQIANYVFNKYGPSLFISIHVNASKSKKSYGFETWYLVEEYRRNIVKSGNISNDADVETVLNSMLNDEIYKESKYLANRIQFHLNNEIGYVSLDRGIKEQTYFVIKKSIMPAVLVEIGFNTNKYEEIRLTKHDYLNKIAKAILNGIIDFIKLYEQTNGYTK